MRSVLAVCEAVSNIMAGIWERPYDAINIPKKDRAMCGAGDWIFHGPTFIRLGPRSYPRFPNWPPPRREKGSISHPTNDANLSIQRYRPVAIRYPLEIPLMRSRAICQRIEYLRMVEATSLFQRSLEMLISRYANNPIAKGNKIC